MLIIHILATSISPVSDLRLGAEAGSDRLSVRVLGNPVVGQMAQVEISGVDGQRVSLDLVDLTGRSLQTHRIEQAAEVERVSLSVGQLPAQFMLQVSTGTQR